MKRCKFLSVLIMAIMITCLCLPVVQAKTKIAISDKKISIEVGNSYQLSIKGAKSNVTWSSADAMVATVSDDGTVLGISKGKVKVTGKYNNKNYSCTITVKSSDELSSYIIPKNEIPLTASYLFEDITDLVFLDEDDDNYIFIATNESISNALDMLYDISTNSSQMLVYDITCDEGLSTFNVCYSSRATSITHDSNIKIVKSIRDYVYLYRLFTGQSTDNVTFYFSQENGDINTISDGTTNYIDIINLRETFN